MEESAAVWNRVSVASVDQGYKRTLYARHGVRGCWIDGSDLATMTVLTLGHKELEVMGTHGEGETFRSSAVEGFAQE